MQNHVCAQEEWLPIPNFDGYEVSSFGQVRSYLVTSKYNKLCKLPKLKKLVPTKDGKYLQVGLSSNSGWKTHRVHTLVLTTFIGPKPTQYHECCHADGNASNNLVSNLRWGTPTENANDRVKHGTQIKGESCNLSVLKEDQVKEIKQALPLWKRGLGKFFAAKFNVCEAVVSSIKNGKTWAHI